MRRLALAVLLTPLAACTQAPPPAPLGLPAMEIPADNPLTAQKAALGRKLFFDRRLSPNGTMSCAMCHVPEQGFTAHELATPVGIEGRSVRRNAPTVLNAGWLKRLFHDGREISLENQVWGPMLAANEMGNPSIGYVIERILGLEDYKGRFEAAFDGKGVSAERIGAALATYERTLVAADSRFDRWRYGGDSGALSSQEQSGFGIFTGKGRCAACHLVGEKDALFTDHAFHNTGVGWRRGIEPAARTRVQLAPGVYAELERRTIETFAEAPPADVGRYEITLDPKDRWAYRTPSLRNVALTAPYMHDGSLPSLEAVVEFYDGGGIDNPERSPLLAPLRLSVEERAALVAFLKALTGSGIEALVAQARETPGGLSR
jgi:cytochrome c peroxidase